MDDRMVTGAICLALIAGACGGGTTSVAAPPIEPPTTATAIEATVPPSEPTPAETATEAVFDADAPVYGSKFSPIEPGTYRVDGLGTPFSFTLEEDWSVQPNEPGFFVLSNPASVGPGDRDIVFLRPTGLADPLAPAAPRDLQDFWALDDIEGWLDALVDGVVIEDRIEVMLGGRPALRFDLTLDDSFACGVEFCMGFVGNGSRGGTAFNQGEAYRVHWIAEEHGPIAIVTGGGPAGKLWFDDAEAMLATVAFGDPAPHPIDPDRPEWEQGVPADVPAGPVRLGAAGIAFRLDEDRFIFQNNGLVIVELRLPAAVVMFRPVTDVNGNDMTDLELIASGLSADEAVEITEVDSPLDLRVSARVFDVRASGATSFGLKWDDAPGRQWDPPAFSRVWLLDTDGGVVVVSAESFEDPDAQAVAIGVAQQILPTLDAIDAG